MKGAQDGRRYRAERARAIAYGQWHPWGDVQAVRAHLATLREAGASYRIIGQAAGLSAATLSAIVNGTGPVKAATADAVLAVRPHDFEPNRLPASGTTYQLR